MSLEFVVAPNRIFAEKGPLLMAEVSFPLVGDRMVDMNHTFVDPSLRGQGIASQMFQLALEHIEKQGWTVTPTCHTARAWLERHTEWHHLLKS